MKILIVSDSHGNMLAVREAIKKEQPIDMLFHCGDVEGNVNLIEDMAGCPCHVVSGNCDFFSGLPKEKIVEVSDKKFFITHGHNYGVSYGSDRLFYLAKQCGYDVVMYGHTHVPFIEKQEGVWIINPGSISRPRTSTREYTYAVMDIDENGDVSVRLKNI